MDKDLLRFINGEISVARITYIVRRDPPLPNGVERYTGAPEEMPKFLPFERFDNPKKPVKSDKPKHTGGKKPYVMLMVDEIDNLRKQGVKNVEELIGYLVCLGKYVEWNTGKLIHKRSKKPLQYKDLTNIFPCGNRKLNRILVDLKEYDLLYKTQEGYFVSSRIIKKGAKKKEADRNG